MRIISKFINILSERNAFNDKKGRMKDFSELRLQENKKRGNSIFTEHIYFRFLW